MLKSWRPDAWSPHSGFVTLMVPALVSAPKLRWLLPIRRPRTLMVPRFSHVAIPAENLKFDATQLSMLIVPDVEFVPSPAAARFGPSKVTWLNVAVPDGWEN